MNKKIYIKESTIIKSGFGKQGRQWNLYKVVDQDNVVYTTFDSKYQVGQTMDIVYEEKQNGNFTNRNIIEPKKAEASKTGDEILSKLNEILLILKRNDIKTAVNQENQPIPTLPVEPQDFTGNFEQFDNNSEFIGF